MRSLRGRIVSGLLISLVAVFVIQAILVTLAIRRVTENYASARLEHEIENLAAVLQFDPDGRPTLGEATINRFYQRPFSGHYFRIASPGGTLVSRSLWDWRLDMPQLSPGKQARLHLQGPRTQSLLVLAHAFSKQGVDFTIAVAEDFSQVEADIRHFQIGYALISVLFLATLAGLAAWRVRTGLRPLQRARRQLAALQSGEISTLDEQVPREIQPLVGEVNRLLVLIRQRLERSRKATGNLAHGLKTPLSILTRLCDDPALAHHESLRRTLSAQVRRMQDLIERELKLARLAGGSTGGTSFAAAQELPALVDTLERIYRERGIHIELHADPAHRFPADREDMLELFGNLLDNACQWARHRVLLRIESGAGLSATVADDGPGVEPSQLDELLQRGKRLDESRDGHGLGLAIVGDIVHQYGGELAFARAPSLGGLEVRVRLPAQKTTLAQN